MSKRKVTLKLTSQKDLIFVESNARTFGELKEEMSNIKWDGMRVVERSTKTTLQLDEAILPAGEFVLFLVPEKVKSGMGKVKGLKKLKNIAGANYNELRSHGSYLNKVKNAGISMNGGTDNLRKAIQAYYDAKNPAKPSSENVSIDDAVLAIETARTNINTAIDAIIANAGTKEVVVEDTTVYLVKTSIDDLENELKSIKNTLKL